MTTSYQHQGKIFMIIGAHNENIFSVLLSEGALLKVCGKQFNQTNGVFQIFGVANCPDMMLFDDDFFDTLPEALPQAILAFTDKFFSFTSKLAKPFNITFSYPLAKTLTAL